MNNNFMYGTTYGKVLTKEFNYTFINYPQYFTSVSSNDTNFITLEVNRALPIEVDSTILITKFNTNNWTNGSKLLVYNKSPYYYETYNGGTIFASGKGIAIFNRNNPVETNIVLNPNNLTSVSAMINGNIGNIQISNRQIIEFLYYNEKFYEIG